MSKPDLDIIHSPEAETFLRMVTKGFYDNSYIGLWMYEVIGREWDEMRAWAEGMKIEINPQTCTWSVAIWEWVYGIESDETLKLEYRRQRILAKILGTKPINPEVIRRGVAALTGAEVEVEDFSGPYRFDVVMHPTEAPLPYAKVFRYIREIKPAHLAFEAAVETKVDITIEIDTRWNLLGFGLTGQYNAGTRPNTNTKAALRDLVVTVDAGGLAALFQPESTGTVFASGYPAGEAPQRMPAPSTAFSQAWVEVDAEVSGSGYAVKAPPAAQENRETGQYPHTQIKGGTADISVSPEISTIGAVFTADQAGTKPQTNIRFTESGTTEVTAEIGAHGYKVPHEITGTKPQPSVRLAEQLLEVTPDIGAGAYRARYQVTQPTGSETGRQPNPQILTAAAGTAVSPDIQAQGYPVSQPTAAGTIPQTETQYTTMGGGVTPSIETDSYRIAFRMCGTEVTTET